MPFTIQPKLKLVDIDGTLVTVLGHGSLSNWTVTASILNGTGDSMAVLEGNVSVEIVEGWANFTDLSITHNGSDYKLLFNVSKPAASHFNATSLAFEVKERIMYFTVTVQPDDANETVSFGQQPRIEVRDAANGDIVDNTGWKGRQWLFKASIANPDDNEGHLNGTTEVEFTKGLFIVTFSFFFWPKVKQALRITQINKVFVLIERRTGRLEATISNHSLLQNVESCPNIISVFMHHTSNRNKWN